MSHTVTLYDETVFGAKSNPLSLDFLTETITVRELIRERVYAEVRAHHAAPPALLRETFRGLIQPADAKARRVDWEAQFARAIEAFGRNGFFVLVNDRQVELLDETITLSPTTRVSFVKLVPLVGG